MLNIPYMLVYIMYYILNGPKLHDEGPGKGNFYTTILYNEYILIK